MIPVLKNLVASQAKTYGLNSLNILVKVVNNAAIISTIWSLKLLSISFIYLLIPTN